MQIEKVFYVEKMAWNHRRRQRDQRQFYFNYTQYSCKQLYWLVNNLREKKGNGAGLSELFAELRATMYCFCLLSLLSYFSLGAGPAGLERQ